MSEEDRQYILNNPDVYNKYVEIHGGDPGLIEKIKNNKYLVSAATIAAIVIGMKALHSYMKRTGGYSGKDILIGIVVVALMLFLFSLPFTLPLMVPMKQPTMKPMPPPAKPPPSTEAAFDNIIDERLAIAAESDPAIVDPDFGI